MILLAQDHFARILPTASPGPGRDLRFIASFPGTFQANVIHCENARSQSAHDDQLSIFFPIIPLHIQQRGQGFFESKALKIDRHHAFDPRLDDDIERIRTREQT